MKEGQVLTQTQLETVSRMLENGMKNVNNITKSEIQQIHSFLIFKSRTPTIFCDEILKR